MAGRHPERLDPAALKAALQSSREYHAADPGQKRRLEEEQANLLQRLEAIDSLARSGLGPYRIKNQLGLSDGVASIRAWIARKRLPRLADAFWLARNPHRDFAFDRDMSELSAYYLLCMHHNAANGNLEHTSNDQRLARHLAALLKPFVGRSVACRTAKNHYWSFKIRAKELGEYLLGITRGKSAMPHRLLDTRKNAEASCSAC